MWYQKQEDPILIGLKQDNRRGKGNQIGGRRKGKSDEVMVMECVVLERKRIRNFCF